MKDASCASSRPIRRRSAPLPHAYRLMYRVRAFMPPQGLLLIAAYLPERWPVRFVDENIAPATAADFAWADVVLVSGMHIQAPQIHDIARARQGGRQGHGAGRASVSARRRCIRTSTICTSASSATPPTGSSPASTTSVAPPAAQVRFETNERLPLSDFPIPAYDLIRARPLSDRQLAILQRLPVSLRVLRHPRALRPPAAAEDAGADHRRARRHDGASRRIRRWSISSTTISSATARRRARCCRIWSPGRSKHGYPLQFACEATLNIAKQTEILALMREAHFLTVFVGIETPDADALKAMRKEHNATLPMMDAIKTLNSYGLEVTSGIILGLDTDTADTESRLKDFIDLSQIPMLTINLLQALPKTPLWDRLKRDGRLIADDSGARKQRALPAPLRRGGGDVAALHRLCLRPGAAVRALSPSGRRHLRQPHDHPGARQAHHRPICAPRWCWRSTSCFASDYCRIIAGRSGAPRATRSAAARSTPCSASASWPIT